MDICVYYEPWLRAYRAYDRDEEDPCYVGIGRTQQEAIVDLLDLHSSDIPCHDGCSYDDWKAQ